MTSNSEQPKRDDLIAAYNVLIQYGAQPLDYERLSTQQIVNELDGSTWPVMHAFNRYGSFEGWKQAFDQAISVPENEAELRQHLQTVKERKSKRNGDKQSEETDSAGAPPPDESGEEVGGAAVGETPAAAQVQAWWQDYEKVKLLHEKLVEKGLLKARSDLKWMDAIKELCASYGVGDPETFERGSDLLKALLTAHSAQKASKEEAAPAPAPAPASAPPDAVPSSDSITGGTAYPHQRATARWWERGDMFSNLERLARLAEKGGLLKRFGANDTSDQRIARAQIAMLLCIELNITPTSALNHFSAIQGNVTPSTALLVALAREHGLRIEIVENDEKKATVRGTRSDTKESVTVTWTLQDAQRAELTRNPLWQRFPRQMLLARAQGEVVRTLGVVLGLPPYGAEELADSETAIEV